MFVFANFLDAFATVISYAVTIYMWLIIIRSLLSWVNPDPYNQIVIFLNKATEPVLYQVRKRIPYIGGIDFSPLVVIIVLVFVQLFVVQTLHDVAFQLKIGG